MTSYWSLVNKQISEADILLLIMDARMPELTRNAEIESKIREREKKIIYVLNKCDLIAQSESEKIKKNYDPCVFVSSKKRLGGTLLFKKIMEVSGGKPCVVGVLGYPNVGKSSVINLLKGKKAATVSPHAGYTHGIQAVRAKGKIRLIDTPGVFPFRGDDMVKQLIIGSRNPEQIKEPEFFAMKLVEKFPAVFERYYSIKYENDVYDFFEKAAMAKRVLVKGGGPDMQRFSRQLLYDWQRGKVHEFMLQTRSGKTAPRS